MSSSKLWIYQADRLLSPAEEQEIQKEVQQFVDQWKAHGAALQAQCRIEKSLFLIIEVDESFQEATGCSIDASVHFIKKIGADHSVDFFNRQNIAYLKEDKLLLASMLDFAKMAKDGDISPSTWVYDTSLSSGSQMAEKWPVQIQNSWHKRYFA